jgi:hypothetical protein
MLTPPADATTIRLLVLLVIFVVVAAAAVAVDGGCWFGTTNICICYGPY